MAAFSKVVLVTGGSSGLGRAMCSRLTAIGHSVYGTSRQIRSIEKSEGINLIGMDVTSDRSVNDAIDEVVRHEGRIDVLINNAGIGIQGPIEDIPGEMAAQIFGTNVIGMHRVCRAVLPHMRSAKSGLIINISSIAANFGLPYRGFYSASKAAVDRYGEALSLEVRDLGIKVVTVQPGEFNTSIGSKRLRPEKIGDAYAARYGKVMRTLEESLGNSRDPDELARVIAKIISDPTPASIYYAAQGQQKLSVILKKLLPGRMFERMLARHFK